MEKKFNQWLITLLIGFVLVLALLVGPVIHEDPSSRLKITLILVVGTAVLVGFLIDARRRWDDRTRGRASEDEFIEVARMNASVVAFKMSMVLWLVIFASQDFFDSTRTMLGTGILGQCGFYGICLAFFKRSGSLYED